MRRLWAHRQYCYTRFDMPEPVIFIGADHAGFALKERLKAWLVGRGRNVEDLSPAFEHGDDYPAHGFRVARRVARTKGARGVLVCGSGVGVAIAANRVKGVRAFDAFDARTTKLAREHNDANVIALSGWHLAFADAKRLVGLFLKTNASAAARHRRRVRQLG